MNAYIIEAKRTAIGRSHPEKGVFRNTRADELLVELLQSIANTIPEDNKSIIDDVYIGCVGQHLEQGKNIARLASMLAGLPETIPGVTINRLCASSLQAFNFAAMTLDTGQADVLFAGGVEHMHHVPMTAALDYSQKLLGQYEFPFTQMGLTAEKVAQVYGISRLEQDEFALASHKKAIQAQKAGYFENEIITIKTPNGFASQDQSPRADTELEALSALKSAFKENGTVTAGNSSPLSDGASLALVASENGCKALGKKRRAQVIGMSVVGLDPCLMGMGPVPAIQNLLKKTNLDISNIGIFEINEAFASQAIACVRELKIPQEKVNLCGGAIALGHPLGCTGTRLIATLLGNMERTKQEFGIAAMCIGHGQGIATLLRLIND